MSHPNFYDKIALRFDPHYLYPGQLCQNVSEVYAGILHKVLTGQPYWKTMRHSRLKPGSSLRYLGLAKALKITSDLDPKSFILELVHAQSDDEISSADTISLSPSDRQFLVAAPNDVS